MKTKETFTFKVDLQNAFIILITTIIGWIIPFTLLSLWLVCIGMGDRFSAIQNNIPDDIAWTTAVLGALAGGYVWLRFWKDITGDYDDR